MPEALTPESVPASVAAAPAPVAQSTPEVSINAVEAPTPAPAAEPPRVFTQEDIDKIVTKRLSKAQRSWERERQQLLDGILSTKRGEIPQAPQGVAPADEGRPDPAKFSDFQAYVQAEIAHGVKQQLAGLQQATTAAEQRNVEVQRHAILAQGVQKQFEAGVEKYSDFEDIVSDPDLPITQAMAEVLAESEVGADLAYYLGKNPKEAARIARLPAISAARELGKLEAKLPTLAAPAVSKAPPPVTPTKGAAGGEKDPSQMTDAEFNAWRQKQIKARQGR